MLQDVYTCCLIFRLSGAETFHDLKISCLNELKYKQCIYQCFGELSELV